MSSHLSASIDSTYPLVETAQLGCDRSQSQTLAEASTASMKINTRLEQ